MLNLQIVLNRGSCLSNRVRVPLVLRFNFQNKSFLLNKTNLTFSFINCTLKRSSGLETVANESQFLISKLVFVAYHNISSVVKLDFSHVITFTKKLLIHKIVHLKCCQMTKKRRKTMLRTKRSIPLLKRK